MMPEPFESYVNLIKFLCDHGFISHHRMSMLDPTHCYKYITVQGSERKIAVPTKLLTDFVEKELNVSSELKKGEV